MLIREKLVKASLAAARAGIREVGANNHGPHVKKFLGCVGLPEGYAWCDAFVSYELHAAAGRHLPIESASVAVTYEKAKQLGWLASRPARGDLVLFDFDGDGRANDHIGVVVKVLKRGPWLTLRTVEGNTSSGRAGSQADGGGVYMRTRIVRRSRVAFVRVPGHVPPVRVTLGPATSSSTTTRHGVTVVVKGNATVVTGPKPKPKPRAKPKPAPKKKPAPKRAPKAAGSRPRPSATRSTPKPKPAPKKKPTTKKTTARKPRKK